HTTATGRDKMEHSSESHDDEIFGSAISTFINHDIDTLADRGNKKLMPRTENETPEIDLTPYGGLKINPYNNKNDSVLILDRSQFTEALLDRFRS
ncbi:MAG: hypothetical protein ACREJN_08080, partial [Nitrospiraceae bacterium]